LAISADRGRSIEVSPFGEHLAGALGQCHQAMLDAFAMALFDCQYLAVVPLHIAIAAVGFGGQGARGTAFKALGIDLLILFVDEQQPVTAQAEAAAAVFIDPAARAEAIGREATCLVVTPLPDAANAIGGAELVPEQACVAELEFGKVGAGGDGLGGAEVSRGR